MILFYIIFVLPSLSSFLHFFFHFHEKKIFISSKNFIFFSLMPKTNKNKKQKKNMMCCRICGYWIFDDEWKNKTKNSICSIIQDLHTNSLHTHTLIHSCTIWGQKKAQCQYIFIQITIGIHTISCVFFVLFLRLHNKYIYIYQSWWWWLSMIRNHHQQQHRIFIIGIGNLWVKKKIRSNFFFFNNFDTFIEWFSPLKKKFFCFCFFSVFLFFQFFFFWFLVLFSSHTHHLCSKFKHKLKQQQQQKQRARENEK